MTTNAQNYTVTIVVAKSPHVVFTSLSDVSKWWGGKDLEGRTTRLGDEFTITHLEARPPHSDVHYSKQKVIELVPDRKVVWLITESRLAWLERDKQEWTNTRLVFQITPKGENALLRFTHEGLVPRKECYARCTDGWNMVIKDWLFHFITDGTAHFQ